MMQRYVMVKSNLLTNEMANRSTSLNVDVVRRATFTETFLHWFEKDVEYAILEFDADDEPATALFINEYWLTNAEVLRELEGEKVSEV